MSDDIPATVEELEAKEQQDTGLFYGSVFEFFEKMIVPLLRDRLIDPRSGLRWSKRWWNSPEAMMRLDALWRAFEHLRHDPGTGISVWFRDHFDVHMAVLTAVDGPFGKSRDVSERGEDPPHEPPPDELLTSI